MLLFSIVPRSVPGNIDPSSSTFFISLLWSSLTKQSLVSRGSCRRGLCSGHPHGGGKTHRHSNCSLAGKKTASKAWNMSRCFVIISLAPLRHGTKFTPHKGAVIVGSVGREATGNESGPFVLHFSSTSIWLETFTPSQQPITWSQQLSTPVFSTSPCSQTRCLLLTHLKIRLISKLLKKQMYIFFKLNNYIVKYCMLLAFSPVLLCI